jgi:hypothetical protein
VENSRVSITHLDSTAGFGFYSSTLRLAFWLGRPASFAATAISKSPQIGVGQGVKGPPCIGFDQSIVGALIWLPLLHRHSCPWDDLGMKGPSFCGIRLMDFGISQTSANHQPTSKDMSRH